MGKRLYISPIQDTGGNGWGFFSNYRACLHRLIECEKIYGSDVDRYISWDNTVFVDGICPLPEAVDGSLYHVGMPENPKDPFNVWFDQTPLKEGDELIRATGPISSPLLDHAGDYFNTKEIIFQKKIDSKYFKLKKDIQDKINTYADKNFKNKITLGVMARGAESHEAYGAFTVEDNLNEIHRVLKLHPEINKIYIVCEDQKWINVFEKELDNVYYHSDFFRRTTQDDSVFEIWTWPYTCATRQNHGTRLGEEMIIQAKLLGKCDYLLGKHSGTLCGAILFNENIRQRYILGDY
jgi:hypothetical protein